MTFEYITKLNPNNLGTLSYQTNFRSISQDSQYWIFAPNKILARLKKMLLVLILDFTPRKILARITFYVVRNRSQTENIR